MIVWTVIIPVFWHVTTRNLRAIHTGRRAFGLVVDYWGAILTACFLVIIALIAMRFWGYWTTPI